MRLFYLLCLLLISSLTPSCSSSRQLNSPKVQAERLSQKLGFKISKKDNLRLYTEAEKWLGIPYQYGGHTQKGTDCSGLVGEIYKQVYQRPLERRTEDIAKKDCRKIGKQRLKPGDLVFFNTAKKREKESIMLAYF